MTIYFGAEVGDGRDRYLPVVDRLLGCFSTPGLEPSPFHESGVSAKTNQDRACAVIPLFPSDDPDWFFAGVFDGLGLYGDKISDFVVREFIKNLQSHPAHISRPGQALKDAFYETDEALRTHPQMKFSAVSSGTTVCVVRIQ
jgi:serine/threonine protein phosphatase PrpC